MDYQSEQYYKLRKLLKKHCKATLIAYPGGNKPKLKIIDASGLTILGATYDVVIDAALTMLDKESIDHDLRETDDGA